MPHFSLKASIITTSACRWCHSYAATPLCWYFTPLAMPRHYYAAIIDAVTLRYRHYFRRHAIITLYAICRYFYFMPLRAAYATLPYYAAELTLPMLIRCWCCRLVILVLSWANAIAVTLITFTSPTAYRHTTAFRQLPFVVIIVYVNTANRLAGHIFVNNITTTLPGHFRHWRHHFTATPSPFHTSSSLPLPLSHCHYLPFTNMPGSSISRIVVNNTSTSTSVIAFFTPIRHAT